MQDTVCGVGSVRGQPAAQQAEAKYNVQYEEAMTDHDHDETFSSARNSANHVYHALLIRFNRVFLRAPKRGPP